MTKLYVLSGIYTIELGHNQTSFYKNNLHQAGLSSQNLWRLEYE